MIRRLVCGVEDGPLAGVKLTLDSTDENVPDMGDHVPFLGWHDERVFIPINAITPVK